MHVCGTKYSFAFEFAYRCLIRWLESARKKGTKKNLFYIISNVHAWWYFSTSFFRLPSFGLTFEKNERKKICSNYYKLLSSSICIPIWEKCAKYQSVSMLFKRFTFFPLIFIYVHNFFLSCCCCWFCLYEHIGTQLILSHRIRFLFNRNRFVINSVLTIDVRVYIYFIKYKRHACNSTHSGWENMSVCASCEMRQS